MFVRLKLIAGAEKADGVYHRHCQDYKVAEVEHTAGDAAKQRNNGHQRHDSAGNERRTYRLHSSAAEGAKPEEEHNSEAERNNQHAQQISEISHDTAASDH